MSIIVPDVGEVEAVTLMLTPNLELKLYSNDKTPAEGDDINDYIEVVGGGYFDRTLILANWTISAAGIATYTTQDFTFSSTPSGPGTVYGYYVVNPLTGVLRWAERFPEPVLPFTPIADTLIRITPKFQGS